MIKIAIPVVKDVTAQQFDNALEQYANAIQNENILNNELDQEMDAIRKKYAPKLACAVYSKNSAYAVVETYCKEQKQTLFASRRSIGTPYGIVGFRLGTPRLKMRKGYNQKKILELLAAKLPQYVRTTVAPAKALLLAHRNTEMVASRLHEVGFEVVQHDQFYIQHPSPQALQKSA